MSEIYQFTWGETRQVKAAISLAEKIMCDTEYGHIETKDFDLDIDKIGIRVRIPHDRELNDQRESM